MAVVDPPKITEAFLMEWVNFGISELMAYLAKWDGFDAWCATHNRP